MGIGISNWYLANTVAAAGQIGVVSSTGLDVVFVRRLQDGDSGGNMRRAISFFPDKIFADEVLKKYYIQGGKLPTAPYV